MQLLNFPLQVFAKVRQRQDELMREFALLAFAPPKDRPGHAVPQSLLELIDTLGTRYAGVGQQTDAVRDRALANGDISIDLTYQVPRSICPALTDLSNLFDQADEFCRHDQMLTLAAPPQELEFRAWFVGQFVGQAAGRPPTAWAASLAPHC